MDALAELARFKPDPALADWVAAQLDKAQIACAERDRLAQAIRSQADALAHKDAQIRHQDLQIQALTLELAHHKRIRFGHKNEAFTPEQRDLFQETCDSDLESIRIELEQLQAQPAPSKRTPTGRKALPAQLPRIEHRHEPDSCTCGQCGRELVQIGEDISEQLDIEPARFFVHRHIRPQYACRNCETVTAAPIPPTVIDGGLAAPGLHAWVLIQKFLDHLPLYRIEQISTRHGCPIARSTLAEWVGRLGVVLQPLSARLAELLKQQTTLHADETPVQQLDPGAGKTRRAYLWAYRSNDLSGGPPIVVFDYQPSRSGAHAQRFLQGWQGHLMVDDYAGYKALFGQGMIELGCWAHARRKFYELHAAGGHPVAAEALRRIGQLYAIEAEAQDGNAATRQVLRQRDAQPKLAELHAWLIAQRQKTADGSGLAKALDYSLKRWPALVRYAEGGAFPIDNNAVENAIRPIALGRKNWLFTGSERAGKRAAAIQSLLATAKLNGLEPLAWLTETLEKLPTWPNSRIDALLPLRQVVAA